VILRAGLDRGKTSVRRILPLAAATSGDD